MQILCFKRWQEAEGGRQGSGGLSPFEGALPPKNPRGLFSLYDFAGKVPGTAGRLQAPFIALGPKERSY
jgi:hypothetical protein